MLRLETGERERREERRGETRTEQGRAERERTRLGSSGF